MMIYIKVAKHEFHYFVVSSQKENLMLRVFPSGQPLGYRTIEPIELSESRHLMAAPILLSLKFLCLWSFTFVYLDSVCYYRVCEWFVHVFSVVLRLYLGANISY
jgi:hypothetical protein